MPIALLHGGSQIVQLLMFVAIAFGIILVLIFVLFVRWAESRMRSREELEKFIQETEEIK